jgi:hypothetical protein
MTTINVSYGYGAGDVMMSLYGMDSPSATIVPLARRRPKYTFRAVICSHCDSVSGLFENNPYFGEMTCPAWTDGSSLMREEAREGHPYLDEIVEGHWPRERMPFFLSAAQQRLFDKATRAPYVALHLFAGGADRSWLQGIGDEGALQLVHVIIEAGWPVVLLGGSSRRREGAGTSRLRESLRGIGAAAGVTDLLGVGGLKLHAAITAHSAAVLGGMSCFVSLATKYDKPMFVVAPRYQKPAFERRRARSPDERLFGSEREVVAAVRRLGRVRFLEETPLDLQLCEIERFLTELKRKR